MSDIVLDSYRSRTVWATSPDWQMSPRTSFARNAELWTTGGTIARYDYTDYSSEQLRFGYLLWNRTQIVAMRDFFDANVGRLHSFWVPSWRRDIIVDAAFSASDTVLSITNIEFSSFWMESVGRWVMFLFPDGTRIYKQITAAPSPTLITLDKFIGKACSAADLPFLQVSFLYWCRIGSDELEMRHGNHDVAEVELTFVGLPNETPSFTSTTSTTSTTSSTQSTISTNTGSTTSETTTTTSSTHTSTTTTTIDPLSEGTFKPAANGDDGSCRNGTTWYAGNTWVAFGVTTGGTYTYNAFIRFPSVTIPKDSTIVSAKLRMKADATDLDTTCRANVYFEAADNPNAPANCTEYNARTMTTGVSWNPVEGWTAGNWYESPDISAALQEVVDRTNWASGQSTIAYIKNNGSDNGASRTFWSYDSADSEAELVVTWIPPA